VEGTIGVPYGLASASEKHARIVSINDDWQRHIVCTSQLHVTSIPSSQWIGPRSVRGNLSSSLVLYSAMSLLELPVKVQSSTCTGRMRM